VLNVCGGGSTSLLEVVAIVGDVIGREVILDRRPVEAGDVVRTGGSGARAFEALGWAPTVTVRDGLARQGAWHRDRRDRSIGEAVGQ
jgi:nucleoside-diphosphate-sugar epimerase